MEMLYAIGYFKILYLL